MGSQLRLPTPGSQPAPSQAGAFWRPCGAPPPPPDSPRDEARRRDRAHLASDAPDSPHLVVGRITGRVAVAGAQDDGSFPPEQAELLERALTEGGVHHTLETYAALHGFAVPDNPTYDEAAAARHWQALDELYGAMLTN
jgi:dienelactone hydrolase